MDAQLENMIFRNRANSNGKISWSGQCFVELVVASELAQHVSRPAHSWVLCDRKKRLGKTGVNLEPSLQPVATKVSCPTSKIVVAQNQMSDGLLSEIYSFCTGTACKLTFKMHLQSSTWCTVLCILSVLKCSLSCQQNPPCCTQINLVSLGSRKIKGPT